MTVFRVVAPCSLVDIDRRFGGTCCLYHQGALMMEAAGTSKTSVNLYQTTRYYNQEDRHLHVSSCLVGGCLVYPVSDRP
jgi:hypothetical protein